MVCPTTISYLPTLLLHIWLSTTESIDIALHPSVEQDLCLKIEVRDQAIWKSTPELLLICSIQMKSKYIGNFSQKSTRWRWPWSKMHQIKKATALIL